MMREETNEDNIIHFSWTQVTNHNNSRYGDTDILLQTGLTFSVFKNQEILLNIRDSKRVFKSIH